MESATCKTPKNTRPAQANTTPTRPSQITVSSGSKPGGLMHPFEAAKIVIDAPIELNSQPLSKP
jgi:hypothetical protein